MLSKRILYIIACEEIMEKAQPLEHLSNKSESFRQPTLNSNFIVDDSLWHFLLERFTLHS